MTTVAISPGAEKILASLPSSIWVALAPAWKQFLSKPVRWVARLRFRLPFLKTIAFKREQMKEEFKNTQLYREITSYVEASDLKKTDNILFLPSTALQKTVEEYRATYLYCGFKHSLPFYDSHPRVGPSSLFLSSNVDVVEEFFLLDASTGGSATVSVSSSAFLRTAGNAVDLEEDMTNDQLAKKIEDRLSGIEKAIKAIQPIKVETSKWVSIGIPTIITILLLAVFGYLIGLTGTTSRLAGTIEGTTGIAETVQKNADGIGDLKKDIGIVQGTLQTINDTVNAILARLLSRSIPPPTPSAP